MFLANKKISLFLIIAIVILQGCYDESDYVYSAEEILEDLEVNIAEPMKIPADGSSKLIINYSFPADADAELTNLLIITSNGTFVESEDDTLKTNFLLLDKTKERRVLQATLKASTTAGIATIRTKLLNYEDVREVMFTEATTTAISLEASPFYFKKDTLQIINISASVNSIKGKASSGRKVLFEVNPNVGFFQSNSASSGANGTANAVYIFTDTSFSGDLTFTAKTTNAVGDTLTTSTEIKVLE